MHYIDMDYSGHAAVVCEIICMATFYYSWPLNTPSRYILECTQKARVSSMHKNTVVIIVMSADRNSGFCIITF